MIVLQHNGLYIWIFFVFVLFWDVMNMKFFGNNMF